MRYINYIYISNMSSYGDGDIDVLITYIILHVMQFIKCEHIPFLGSIFPTLQISSNLLSAEGRPFVL